MDLNTLYQKIETFFDNNLVPKIRGLKVREILTDIVNYITLEPNTISMTYSEFMAAKNAGDLIDHRFYYINNRGITVEAISNNKVALRGQRVMWLPVTYAVFTDDNGNVFKGIFNPDATAGFYEKDDFVIWGGSLWINLSDNNGIVVDDTALDNVNWQLVPKTSAQGGKYIQKSFDVDYDIENDWVIKQYDEFGNSIGIDTTIAANEYGSIVNPVDITDWNLNTLGSSRLSNNVCWGIFNNRNNGGIFLNTLAGTISNNANDGHISNNKIASSILNNTNTGEITNNTNIGGITNNSCGPIVGNSNIGSILENANTGGINSNFNNGDIKTTGANVVLIENNGNLGSIRSNDNVGDIKNNMNLGYILQNTNEGAIINNKNGGGISDNTNGGQIQDNSNLLYIANNSNTGAIFYNSNNGAITSNTNSGNINNNTNNGNIQSNSDPSDVSDSIVNK